MFSILKRTSRRVLRDPNMKPRLVLIVGLLSLMGYMACTRKEARRVEFGVADRGFWQGLKAVEHHYFDEPVAKALVDFFKNESAKSIIELGCGTGAFAKVLKDAGLDLVCYDGNPSTPELTEGRCGVLDISKPIPLFSKYDWTLSLEVGEHVPREYETTVLNNMAKTNRVGIVVSWAVEGQGGMSHVNERNNSYIRERFRERGYSSDFEAEKTLRAASTMYWFKKSIMVFRKQ